MAQFSRPSLDKQTLPGNNWSEEKLHLMSLLGSLTTNAPKLLVFLLILSEIHSTHSAW